MKYLHRIFNVCLYLIVLFTLTASIGSYVFKKPVLLCVIPSYSMYPLLKPGDMVFLKTVKNNSPIKIGDIIVFSNRDENSNFFTDWTIHRVVDGNIKDGYITKGDFNKQTDQQETGSGPVQKQWIAARAITIGKYPLKIPLIGYVSLLANKIRTKPYVLPAITMILAIVIGVSELSGNKRKTIKSNALNSQLLYLLGGITMMVITGASMLTTSQKFNLEYEISDTYRGIMMGSNAGVLKLGDTLEKPLIDLSNNGFLPITATIISNDPLLSFNGDLESLRPNNPTINKTFKIEASNVGKYKSTIWVGMFFPLLPKNIIYILAKKSYWLALIIISTIPGIPLILYPILDPELNRKTKKEIRRKLRRIKRVILFKFY